MAGKSLRTVVTIKDIAREAGVSYATVSRALNNVSGTKDSTSRRVKAIAEAMGYQRNTLAAGLVTRRTNTVGFILPEIGNPFFVKILSAISSVADEYGLTVLICNTEWNSDKELKELVTLSERRVDGILLYPSSVKCNEDGRLNRIDVPLLFFGDVPEDSRIRHHSVIVDNVRGGRIAFRHILDCGYRRVVYLGGQTRSASSRARMRGVKEAMAEAGYKLREADFSEEKYTIESGYQRGKAFLKRASSSRPDAFICSNDLIALGVMQAVAELGYRVGDEIGVIGFDDVPYASLPQIQLSTVRIPCEEMGEIGMRLLVEKILDEEAAADRAPETTTLQPTLVQRQSTKEVKPCD